MAVAVSLTSGAIVMLTGVVDALERFKLTPFRTPETVLVALVIGVPSTVRDASAPDWAWVNPRVVVVVLTTPLAEVVVLRPEIEKLFAAPELLLTMDSRAPLESVITLAVTPRF